MNLTKLRGSLCSTNPTKIDDKFIKGRKQRAFKVNINLLYLKI